MATIVINKAFVAEASLEKPSKLRKKRDDLKSHSKKKKPGSRLRKPQFLELSKKAQGEYLERFPKSTHRNLLVGNKGKADEKPVPNKKGPKAEEKNKHTKKISRDVFDRMEKKEQKEYKKTYPNDSFVGKKHHVAKKKNIVQQNKTGNSGETVLDGTEKDSDVKKRRKAANAANKQERDEAKQDLRHSITPEAVKALEESTPEDFAQTAKSMKKNRTANIADIKKSLENRHEFVPLEADDIEQASANLDKQVQDEDADWSEDEIKSTKKLLKRIKPKTNNKMSKKDRDRLDRVSSKKTKRKKNPPFWKKDFQVLKAIMSGEQVEPEGRSNASLAINIVARYALMAAAGYALSMGAGPAALHVTKTLVEQWGDLSSQASAGSPSGIEDEEEEELSPEQKEDQDTTETLGIIYDAVADQVAHMDHEAFKEDVSKTFNKFERSESSNFDPEIVASAMRRISYRCLPDERTLSINQKTEWGVFTGKRCVGRIKAEPNAKLRSFNLRIWQPVIYEDNFDAIEFPHLDTANESQDMNEPFILTDDEPENVHNLELHHPTLMTMHEARSWMRSIIKQR